MRELFSRTNQEGVTITYYSDERNLRVWSEVNYPRNFKDLQEQLDEENASLPKHKRKFIDDDGKVVSYLTAKKLGLVA